MDKHLQSLSGHSPHLQPVPGDGAGTLDHCAVAQGGQGARVPVELSALAGGLYAAHDLGE